jgi:hypothetical protein
VEQQLREAILTGRLVDLRTRNPRATIPPMAPAGPRSTVPAPLLADLLTDTDGSRRPPALRLTRSPVGPPSDQGVNGAVGI